MSSCGTGVNNPLAASAIRASKRRRLSLDSMRRCRCKIPRACATARLPWRPTVTVINTETKVSASASVQSRGTADSRSTIVPPRSRSGWSSSLAAIWMRSFMAPSAAKSAITRRDSSGCAPMIRLHAQFTTRSRGPCARFAHSNR